MANGFFDPMRRAQFEVAKTASDGSWYGGTPLWVLAEEQHTRATRPQQVSGEPTTELDHAVLNVIPGTDWRPDSSIRVNGTPSNTMALRVEGQEASTELWYTQSWTQPSVDAIQEFAVQTSNYAAEYGQAQFPAAVQINRRH